MGQRVTDRRGWGTIVWLCSTRERELIEELALVHSLHPVAICRFVREVMMANADLPEGGKEFNFEPKANGHGPNCFLLGQVPGPEAEGVNLSSALASAQRDARLVAMALEGKPSWEKLLECYANCAAWAAFWAEHWPSPEGRARWVLEDQAVTAELAGMLSLARAKVAKREKLERRSAGA